MLKVVEVSSIYDDSMKIPSCSVFQSKSSIMEMDDFFMAEQLGTTVEPRCGSCRCGKCPVPGSRYSFREEVELSLIEENILYDED